VSQDDVSTPIAAAVFVGSAILVGLPATALVLSLVDVLFDLLDISVAFEVTALGNIFALGTASAVLFLWLQISYEVAYLRLHGVSALSRGSRVGTLARYLALWAVVVVAVGFLVIVGAFSALALFSSQPIVGVAGLVTALAGLWVFARAGGAFRDGFEATTP
jgi:hypothetical protein